MAKLHQAYAIPATGGSNAMPIVDAYHYPTALPDFNAFAANFALPRETSAVPTTTTNKVFQVVYAAGTKPLSGGSYIASWNMEEALDIEWAHAMAPQAKIYLVEAASDSTADLMAAVRIASSLPGVKEVSMSWGGTEFSYEASYDSVFTTPGVVYFASGGDSGAVMEYPAASPNVVSCGGTTVNRDARGNLLSETGWTQTGCGASAYEPRPIFQNGVASVVGNHRGVSDISFDADPNTGVYVYDSTPMWGESGWWILGGTSVSSPSLAGVVNSAGTVNGFAVNTAAEHTRIYGNLGNANVFRDIHFREKPAQALLLGWLRFPDGCRHSAQLDREIIRICSSTLPWIDPRQRFCFLPSRRGRQRVRLALDIPVLFRMRKFFRLPPPKMDGRCRRCRRRGRRASRF